MVIDNAVEYVNAAREDIEGMGTTGDVASRGDASATRCQFLSISKKLQVNKNLLNVWLVVPCI